MDGIGVDGWGRGFTGSGDKGDASFDGVVATVLLLLSLAGAEGDDGACEVLSGEDALLGRRTRGL